ncbi:MAG: CHASE4 domain-containing protein [Anaerolineae bacterium]
MSLHQKTLLITSAAVVGLFALMLIFSQTVMVTSYEQLEQRAMRQNAWRVINAIQDELNAFQAQTIDWARWDATYHFVEGNYNEFPDDNLMDFVFVSNNVNLMLFVDRQSEVVYGKAVNLQDGHEVTVPQQVIDDVAPESPLANFSDGISGILMVDDTPMLVVSTPILRSSLQGPSNGALIWGRFLDSNAVLRIQEQLRFNLTLMSVNAADMPDDFASALSSLSRESQIDVEVNTQDTVASYMLFFDVYDQPAFVMRLQMPRDIYSQGQNSILYFTVFLLVACALLIVVVMLLLEKNVLSRLEHLNGSVSRIRQSTDWSARVTLHGDDEVGVLAVSINQMLEALTQSQQQEQRARGEAELREKVFKTFSHDVRTPLAAIALYSEMLYRGLYDAVSPRQAEAAQSIHTSAKHLIRFMDNLLDEAQLTAGKLQLHEKTVEIADLVKGVETITLPLAREKKLALNIDTDADLPGSLCGDFERLEQILTNLITNSIKYTNEGEIKVRLTVLDEHHWRIQVSDSGVGISAEALEHIFDPFWQVDDTKTRRAMMGVGLGLSIVKQLVELMSGELEVQSTLGVGSVFTVTLPLVPVAEAPVPA